MPDWRCVADRGVYALAAAAQCEVKTIHGAEKSCRLDIATLVRIAEALDLPYRGVSS